MNRYSRDIILVVKNDAIHPAFTDGRVDCINDIIACVDNVDSFCNAHELVTRNRISGKKRKILVAVRRERLKPFRFLISKN